MIFYPNCDMPKNEAEFEELLALYYAPVLKKVKIANIFHVSDKQFNNVKGLVQLYQGILLHHNIHIYLFQEGCQRLTIYVYKRLCESCSYPHEMGIFLGYPLADVKGFIKKETCLLYGYWKVYANPKRVQELFKLYDRSHDELLNGVYEGKRIECLI